MDGFPEKYSFGTHTNTKLVLPCDPGPVDLLLAPLTFMPCIFLELWSSGKISHSDSFMAEQQAIRNMQCDKTSNKDDSILRAGRRQKIEP